VVVDEVALNDEVDRAGYLARSDRTIVQATGEQSKLTDDKPVHACLIALAHTRAEGADQGEGGEHDSKTCGAKDYQDANEAPSVGNIALEDDVEGIEGVRGQLVYEAVHCEEGNDVDGKSSE